MYIPNQGDIIYLTLNPQTGHEQSGRRPVLIINKHSFSEITKLAVVCPITSTERKVPTHVRVEKAKNTTGFVMCEQVKSLDLKTRNPQYKDKIDNETLFEVIDIVKGFIDFEAEETFMPKMKTTKDKVISNGQKQTGLTRPV